MCGINLISRQNKNIHAINAVCLVFELNLICSIHMITKKEPEHQPDWPGVAESHT